MYIYIFIRVLCFGWQCNINVLAIVSRQMERWDLTAYFSTNPFGVFRSTCSVTVDSDGETMLRPHVASGKCLDHLKKSHIFDGETSPFFHDETQCLMVKSPFFGAPPRCFFRRSTHRSLVVAWVTGRPATWRWLTIAGIRTYMVSTMTGVS